jgi:ribosomal protein S18 acetylase RimI-like enzyme
MGLIELVLVPEDELSDQQKQGVLELERQCFGDVDPKEVEECFYAEVHARILAYFSEKLVGYLLLHRRKIEFDGREIIMGGTVGACVAVGIRGRGIGKMLMKKGLAVLKRQSCDVACLNADPENRKAAFELYKKLGFKLMERRISFEDIHDNVRYDTGTMFTPLNSRELFNHIMNSKSTFHYGKGYW